MFKTKYSGQIEMIGSGRSISDFFMRRTFVKIGGSKIRNVVASDALDDYLDLGVEAGGQATISVGWVMFYRWMLGIATSQDSARQSLYLFLVGMIMHIAVMGLAAVLGGAFLIEMVSPALGWPVGLGIFTYGAVTSALNVKAWLTPLT